MRARGVLEAIGLVLPVLVLQQLEPEGPLSQEAGLPPADPEGPEELVLGRDAVERHVHGDADAAGRCQLVRDPQDRAAA